MPVGKGAVMDKNSPEQQYQTYADVPSNRRSSSNILYIVLSCTIGIPFFIITFWALFTGEIYVNELDGNGRLKTWSKANKYLALYVVLTWVVVFIFVLASL